MNGGTSASGRSFITISGRTYAKKCLIVSTSLEGKKQMFDRTKASDNHHEIKKSPKEISRRLEKVLPEITYKKPTGYV